MPPAGTAAFGVSGSLPEVCRELSGIPKTRTSESPKTASTQDFPNYSHLLSGRSQGRDLAMHVTYRSYLTAGVAALGAGAIALAPVQPIPNHLALAQDKAVATLAVNLASTIDPITPWVDTFETSLENIKALIAFNASDPAPLIRTIVANQLTYLQALPDFQFIGESIVNNIQTFFQSPWWNSEGAPIINGTLASDYISGTQTVSGLTVLYNNQRSIYNVVAPLLAAQGPEWLQPVLEFTATPYSAKAIGLLSPLLSSVVQLTRSFTAVGQYFQDGDVIGAINELINIPANVTNASLNGAGLLDLTEVVKNIVPPAIAALITSFGANLGGLISPPVPYDGSLTNANRPPTVYTAGTLFDVVQTNAVGGLAQTTGLPVGWVESVIGVKQFVAKNLLVAPPTATAAVTPKAAASSEDAAPIVDVPVVADAPEAPPAVTDVPDEVDSVAPVANEARQSAEAPAPRAVSAPGARKSAAAGNDTGSARASHKGVRGKHTR
ncbi:MAG: hypothetical protein H6523_19580 [Mycolicibacterium sp.]|nr:hypothetical protein [Mycolicibacterium sp.]